MPEIAKPLTYPATMRGFERRLAALERRPVPSVIALGEVDSVVPGGAPDGTDLVLVSFGGLTRAAGHSPAYTPAAGDPVVLWVRTAEVVILAHG